MSLTKLLAVGQSIMGLKRKATPYRMSRENWLPKFSPAAPAPVAESDRAEPAGGSLPHVGGARVVPSHPKPGVAQGLNLPERCGREAVPEVAAGAAVVAPAPVHSAPLGESLKQKALGRFDLGWKQWMKSKAAAAMPKLGTRLHQPELDFGQVRVVRNDLRDSDVEIVAEDRLGVGSAAKPSSLTNLASAGTISGGVSGSAEHVKPRDCAGIAG